MRSVVMEARDGLEAEYECTSLAGPHCRTHGPTGNLFTEPEVQSEDDGSLLIQLDDATLGKDGKIDLILTDAAGKKTKLATRIPGDVLGELSLLPAVRAAPANAVIVADGTSCRHQIADGAARRAVHVAEVLAGALHGAAP